MKLKKDSILLFQGDSVTDCYRNREDDNDLGKSYVVEVQEYLRKYNIKVLNKAIAGNRVDHLLNRFDKDFKDVKPDYLILLIGVNDVWHDYPNCKKDNVFEKELNELFDRIKKEMSCDVLILEPFILGFKEEYIIMREELARKVSLIKKLCTKYDYEYLSFTEDFNKVITKENEEQYSIEGIHPLPLGYHLMANKIINNIEIE